MIFLVSDSGTPSATITHPPPETTRAALSPYDGRNSALSKICRTTLYSRATAVTGPSMGRLKLYKLAVPRFPRKTCIDSGVWRGNHV